MRKRIVRIVTMASALVAGLALVPPAADAAVPATSRATCSQRTDFWEMFTVYHGWPVCYANSGEIDYGENPPVTTWTTSKVCSGNNRGDIFFYFWDGTEWLSQVRSPDYFQCIDFVAEYGAPVEVRYFVIA